VEVVSRSYAFEDFHPLDPGEWVKAFAFAWPLLAIAVLRWRKHGRVALGVRVLEPALIAGSAYAVHFISTFLADRRAVGAYLALLALGIYAVFTVQADLTLYREWRGRRT
jgi:hypothetical protein